MTVMAAILKELIAAGLSDDALVQAVARIETAMQESAAPKTTARQERNRRYYEAKRLKASENRFNKTQDEGGEETGGVRLNGVLKRLNPSYSDAVESTPSPPFFPPLSPSPAPHPQSPPYNPPSSPMIRAAENSSQPQADLLGNIAPAVSAQPAEQKPAAKRKRVIETDSVMPETLPPEWAAAANERRRSRGMAALTDRGLACLFEDFTTYWLSLPASKRRSNWRLTWLNNMTDERTEARIKPEWRMGRPASLPRHNPTRPVL